MTDIALGRPLELDDIRRCLVAAFPSMVVVAANAWAEVEGPFDVGVLLDPNPSEFPCGLGVAAQMQEGRDFEAWLCGLAKMLGDHFSSPAICDGSRYGEPPSPYWSLVWERGEAFLADDLDTTLADGEGGPVRIVRKLEGVASQIPDRQTLPTWLQRRAPAVRSG